MLSSVAVDTVQSSRIVVDKVPSSNVEVDTIQQVNLNHLSSTTTVSNRTDIQAHIFQTDTTSTAVLDRAKNQTHIFQTDINKTDNINNTSDIELDNASLNDDENHLSIAEINETSIVSDLADLQFPTSTQIPSISSAQTTPIINVNTNLNNDVHNEYTTIPINQLDLVTALSDTTIHTKTFINSTCPTHVVNDGVTNIVDNETLHKNTDIIVKTALGQGNLPVTIEATSSTLSHDTPLQKQSSSDNSKKAPKFSKDSSTGRTVRFEDEISIPTVSHIQNTTPIKVTNVPLIHSVILCKINSTQHSKQAMNAEEYRQAFPEPDLSSFDHSIYVSVAVQAMSIDDVDKAFPSMSNTAYGNLQSNTAYGGASLTAISEEKATQLQCKFIERKKYQVVVSVANGQQMTSNHYTPLKVTFKGINEQTKAVQFKTVMIIANIVPTLSGGIIIGSDVMKALQVTIPYNDDNTAMLTVNGDTMKFQYSNIAKDHSNPFIRTIKVTKSTRKALSIKHSFNALFFGDSENKMYIRPIPKEIAAQVKAEHKKAMSDPGKYMQEFDYKKPVSISQLVAIHCILSEYDVEGEQQSTIKAKDGSTRTVPITLAKSTTESLQNRSTNTIYDKYIDKYVNSVECLVKKNTNHQQDDIHAYISHQIDSLHNIQYINKLAVVNGEVVEDVAQPPVCSDIKKEQDELLATMDYINNMKKIHCNNTMLDQRPEEFPIDLWHYVFDNQKVLIKDRWELFKSKCSPPERLHDVIKQIMKIDISKENPSRTAEEPFFRAQCLANLHIYAHPDPTTPPSVKGREYEINLTDTSPCTNPMRRTSLLEKAYLYWRTKQLMGRQMIGVSSSAYNNPPLCVPYPAAITAFI